MATGRAASSPAARTAIAGFRLGLGIGSFPAQVMRQGLLGPGEEADAIDFNRGHYDQRSARIIQTVVGASRTGTFNATTVEAVAAWQLAQGGLKNDGKVGMGTLNLMLPGLVASGDHDQAIQLVADFNNLDVTTDTLSIRFDPALGGAGAVTFQAGQVRLIRLGAAAFATSPALLAAIQAQLAAAPPAAAAPGARPAVLTPAEEKAAIAFNREKFSDPRSVRVIQGQVGANPDAEWGPDTVQRIAQVQQAAGLGADGKVGRSTMDNITRTLIGASQEDAALRLIVDFFDFRDAGNLIFIVFDPAEAANASVQVRRNQPTSVRVGPAGIAQSFEGLVHTVAHEFMHIRLLRAGEADIATHEFLGESVEILSEGMPEEPLEAVAPGALGFVPGFANDATRALANWNAMSVAKRKKYKKRFLRVRRRVRARIAAGTAAQQALHAPLLAAYNAVVLP